MHPNFKERIARGDLLLGTVVTLPSTEIADILSGAGFDWLFVDLEHSTIGVRDAQRIVQVSAPSVPCAVRVPANDEVWIKKVLDIGPAGIIVPQVRSAAEVERAVRFCRYPPSGGRSVGIARAHGYGAAFDQYIASADAATAIVVQIEHIDAVRDIAAICRIPGVDALFVGPYDLSASMGKIGQVADPEVQAAVSRTLEAAAEARVPTGIFGAGVEAVRPWIAKGCRLIAVGIDALLVVGAAGAVVKGFEAIRRGVSETRSGAG
jgi:2-keto-3-deoxy-L-rhamnonate aldolase RhmA